MVVLVICIAILLFALLGLYGHYLNAHPEKNPAARDAVVQRRHEDEMAAQRHAHELAMMRAHHEREMAVYAARVAPNAGWPTSEVGEPQNAVVGPSYGPVVDLDVLQPPTHMATAGDVDWWRQGAGLEG